MELSQRLKELNLVNFSKKVIASPNIVHYSTERRGIMGDAPKTTKLIRSVWDKAEDFISFQFLTEATDKYGPDYKYKDTNPEANFTFNNNPSKLYEIELRFYGVQDLIGVIKGQTGKASPSGVQFTKKPIPTTIGKKPPIQSLKNMSKSDIARQSSKGSVKPKVDVKQEPHDYYDDEPPEVSSVVTEAKKPNPTVISIKNWLWSTNFALWSNAPSYHWQGFNWNLSQLHAAIHPTDIKPKVWDKIHGKALVDKHLFDLFIHIKFFMNQMTSALYNKIKPSLGTAPVQTESKESSMEDLILQEVTRRWADEQFLLWRHQKNGAYVVEVYRTTKDTRNYKPVITVSPENVNPKSSKYWEPEDFLKMASSMDIWSADPNAQKWSPDTQDAFKKAIVGEKPPDQQSIMAMLKKAFFPPTSQKEYVGVAEVSKYMLTDPVFNGRNAVIRLWAVDTPSLGRKAGYRATKIREDFIYMNSNTIVLSERNAKPVKPIWNQPSNGTLQFRFNASENQTIIGTFYPDTLLKDSLMSYNETNDTFDYNIDGNQDIDWKKRNEAYKIVSNLKEISFKFEDEKNKEEGEGLELSGKKNVGVVLATVRASILQYIENEKDNFDIFSFEASSDSSSRAPIYLREVLHILQSGDYDYKLMTFSHAHNILTRFFLIKKSVYNTMFPENIQEDIDIKDTLVCAYGNFFPPTKHHFNLIEKVIKTAQENNASNTIFIVPESSMEDDIISLRHKAQFLKEAVPGVNICIDEEIKEIYDVFTWAYNKKYKRIMVIAGAEQIEPIEEVLEFNNDKKTNDGYFKFDNFHVASYGDINPDQSREAISARNALNSGDFPAFMKAVQCDRFKKYEPINKLFKILRKELQVGLGV